MTKKKIFRAVLIFIVLSLILAAGAYVIFTPKKAAEFPEFSPMPMDTAGNNLIGNLPENLEAGGFIAWQSGWIYFANFADGGSLYMCRENGADMTKLTDFAVCNINVLGTTLVFTGYERYAEDNGGIHNNETVLPPPFTDEHIFFGGQLYAVYGIHSTSKPAFSVIDPEITYYSPYLDRDGLYVSYSESEHSVLVNKFGDTKTVFAAGEEIRKRFSSGDRIYAEFFDRSDKKGRIMRLDVKTLLPLDYTDGNGLYRVGKSFIFRGTDGFAYEVTPADGVLKPVSSEPLDRAAVNQFGEIEAGPDTVVISKEQWYGEVAQVVSSWRNPEAAKLQNGWYNYFDAEPRHKDAPKYFKANDKYFYVGDRGWSEAWLNVKLASEPLVSLADVTVEDTFTPPWIDYSENAEPVDTDESGGDFGSERSAAESPDDRADAADDAVGALDAAVLILLGDESIADKYTGVSVEKLRNRYGKAFESAVTDAAAELADTVATKLGVSVNEEEMRDIVVILLENADYSIGGANIASNGEEAVVTLTSSNALDLDALDATFQDEVAVRSASNAEVAEMSAGERAAWMTDVLTEIMRNPSSYDIANKQSADSQIYMTYSDCWIADNPAALVSGLIYGRN